jgi:hypothetical protein
MSSVTCSWGHSWSIITSSTYTIWLALHQYSFYFIPLLIPLLNSVSILIFNMLEMYLHYLYYPLRFLDRIIRNCLLLLIELVELLMFLCNYIRNHGVRRSLADFLIWYIGILNYYTGYLRICLYCSRWLPFITYEGYLDSDDYISSHLNELEELIRIKTGLISRLQRRVSNDIYICGHSNPRWNNIHGRHMLVLQISNLTRSRNTPANIERQCRIIAAIYIASGLTPDQRTLLTNLHDVDRWMLRVNPNHISDFLPLNEQLFNIELTRSRIFTNVSNDMNNFIIVHIYEDGHIEYRFFWNFH